MRTTTLSTRVYVSFAHMQKLADLGYDINPMDLYYEAKKGSSFRVREDDLTDTRRILGGWDKSHREALEPHKGRVLTLYKPLQTLGPGWFLLTDARP